MGQQVGVLEGSLLGGGCDRGPWASCPQAGPPRWWSCVRSTSIRPWWASIWLGMRPSKGAASSLDTRRPSRWVLGEGRGDWPEGSGRSSRALPTVGRHRIDFEVRGLLGSQAS